MVNSQATLDGTYAALADPTRRAMLARLVQGEATVGELAQPFAMSLPAISKHVCVLERAGLVSRRRHGRYQICRLEPDALTLAADWLERHRTFWAAQLNALADVVVATVTVDAPRSVVFTAFTDPAVLAQWFWPQRFGTRIELDLRPGGAFSIRADGLPAGQEMGVSGTYQDVESPGRLAMSCQWSGESAVSHVAIELSEVSETRTEVVVTHSANPSTADRDGHLQGWRDCLGRLIEASGTLRLALRGQ